MMQTMHAPQASIFSGNAGGRTLPLFLPPEEKYNIPQDNFFEAILLPPDSFEFESPVFWNICERTLFVALARHIEKKTIQILDAHFSMGDRTALFSEDATQKMLAKYRRNFGTRKVSDIFSIKTWFFTRGSTFMQHVCKNVATAHTLDDVYNVHGSFEWNAERIFPYAGSADFLSRLYLSCPSAQGTRNRYRLVSRLYRMLGGGRTLSIACGSAQPIIHAVHKMRSELHEGCSRINLLLVDPDTSTLDLAMARARQAGVADTVRTLQASYQELFLKMSQSDERFDVIEACGIGDYLPDEQFRLLIRESFKLLAPGGHLIVSNMAPTAGSDSLTKMYNWSIVYRTPQEFSRLFIDEGLQDFCVYIEPWKVHMVGVVRKSY